MREDLKLTSASINIKRSNPFPLAPLSLSILSFCSVKKENSESERILGTCVFFVGLQCPMFPMLSHWKRVHTWWVNFSQAWLPWAKYTVSSGEVFRHLPSSPSHTAIPRLLSNASSRPAFLPPWPKLHTVLWNTLPFRHLIRSCHKNVLLCWPQGWSQILLHYTELCP